MKQLIVIYSFVVKLTPLFLRSMTKIHLLQFIVNLNNPYSDICYEKKILLKLKYCNIQKKTGILVSRGTADPGQDLSPDQPGQ